MLYKKIIDSQIFNKGALKESTPSGGITIIIENQKICSVLDGAGWIHPRRKTQYISLFNNVLKKHNLPNAKININLSDHPVDGYFNFCRILNNDKQFLLPNHRFTEDDIIQNNPNFDEVIKYVRSKQIPYNLRKSQFYTNCIPHISKIDYFKYALKNQSFCNGYVYGGSVHGYMSLDPLFIKSLKNCGMGGELLTPFETHNNYKYIIYNDGNTLSDRMRLLLCTDSVIVRKKSIYEEFYTYLLSHNNNFIEYDKVEELETIFANLESDDSLTTKIRHNNAHFIDTYLNYDRILEYVAVLINALFTSLALDIK